MHNLSASFVLAYHGCTQTTAQKLLSGKPFRFSKNDYDWLGSGIYFWEVNPKRGLQFASEVIKRKQLTDQPAVVGAVIDLGLCLDLLTQSGIDQIKKAYKALKAVSNKAQTPMPENSPSLLTRYLDCAVVNYMHQIRKNEDQEPIDTIRGIFTEGAPIFPSSGFYRKTHSQICVRNPNCIKGVFRVSGKQLL